MQEFMWDGIDDPLTAGISLGSVKNEALDKIKSKLTKEQLEA